MTAETFSLDQLPQWRPRSSRLLHQRWSRPQLSQAPSAASSNGRGAASTMKSRDRVRRSFLPMGSAAITRLGGSRSPIFLIDFTCVTFSHRGYPPSSDIGIPDPREFAGDLASLIEHLQLPNVRLVAQSMGGWTAIEYILTHPQHNVRALVLASTCGTINRASVPSIDPQTLIEYDQKAAEATADMLRRGISPPAGERMAREQPALHFLYREIANASAAFDRVEFRKRIFMMTNRSPDLLHGFMMPVLFITGEEDIANFPPFIADALAPLMPNARVEHVPEAGHSVYFQRADVFNRLLDNFLSKVG